MRHAIEKNDAGLTLIELMFTAGVMTVGLVLMMSSVISVSAAQKSADIAVRATHFNSSVLDSLRGRELETILQYNADGSEFVITEHQIQLQGVGRAEFYMYCVTMVDGAAVRTSLPLSDEALASFGTTANPMEVQVELLVNRGLGTGKELKFRSSTLVYF